MTHAIFKFILSGKYIFRTEFHKNLSRKGCTRLAWVLGQLLCSCTYFKYLTNKVVKQYNFRQIIKAQAEACPQIKVFFVNKAELNDLPYNTQN